MFVFAGFPTLVAWSVVLLVFHVLLQGQLSTRELGKEWNAGARDDGRKPKGRLAGRAERASKNFRETYPAFVGLALGLGLADPLSAWGHAGAVLWFAARIVYIPLYLQGVPYVRSLVWAVSMLGLLLMFLALIL
jgi:uncharacterized MAPEG superfamily protein